MNFTKMHGLGNDFIVFFPIRRRFPPTLPSWLSACATAISGSGPTDSCSCCRPTVLTI